MAAFDRDGFAALTGVSRETLDRLETYVDLLRRWQRRINLIAPSTIDNIWHRHVLDCWQLAELVPEDVGRIADLGSGAGLPGIVLALARAPPPERPVLLVESDARKCAFLREAVRATAASALVVERRIGPFLRDPGDISVDILTARALAPLENLCEFAALAGAKTCVFPKGKSWREELTVAEKRWKMAVEVFDSRTSADARILRLTGVTGKRPKV